jgi:hypothetical protein
MNATTITAKKAVKKNIDLTNFSFKREIMTLRAGDASAGHSACVMIGHLPLGKKVGLMWFSVSC